jgi:hypothetical protein
MNIFVLLDAIQNHLPLTSRTVKIAVCIASFVIVVVGLSNLLSSPAYAASATPPPNPAATCNKVGFLGLEPWYQYMNKEFTDAYAAPSSQSDPCSVKCFNVFIQTVPNDCGQTASDIPAVLLAVIDDLLRISTMVAIGFVFYGAFQYVASQGNSEVTAQAQTTVINALIGVAIALIAVTAVSFIGDKLAG